MPRLGPPPPDVKGQLRDYLQRMATILDGMPQVSFFSGTSPNSSLTGTTGHLAINIGSASTQSRLWINTAPPTSTATTTGWVVVRIAQP